MSEKKRERFFSGFVTITGRTNVGKSTLFNKLVGEKIAIVTNVPQTTRHRIVGVRTGADYQIAFVDAPGFHKPHYAMNRAMVEKAMAALEAIDLVVFMIAANEPVGGGDMMVANIIKEKNIPALCAINKVDRVRKEMTLPLIERATSEWNMREAIPISALTGENCDRLLDIIIRSLPEGEMLFPKDYLTDQTERNIVSEIIREKVFLNTRQEIPHATAISIERYEEKGEGLIFIEASVFVEKESQKGIIIGRRGHMLKSIGVSARSEIERFLGRTVYLELTVKVRRKWRDNEAMLRRIGLR